jgi:hypothetical protein
MSRYRFIYKDPANGEGRYIDVEANSLAAAIWVTASTLTMDNGKEYELVDTMALPGPENAYQSPVHVNVYPNWAKEDSQ